jgi:pimeloyl-ACP methyl ester carboxylesterase
VEIGYDKSVYDKPGYVDSPAVVLLSGWAHDLSLYDRMFPHLSSKYKVIRVNWRGHGPNQKHTEDFGVGEQVTDTIELL